MLILCTILSIVENAEIAEFESINIFIRYLPVQYSLCQLISLARIVNTTLQILPFVWWKWWLFDNSQPLHRIITFFLFCVYSNPFVNMPRNCYFSYMFVFLPKRSTVGRPTHSAVSWEFAKIIIMKMQWRKKFDFNWIDEFFLHYNNSIYFQWNYFYQCYKINPVGKCLCNIDGGPNGRFSQHCLQWLCVLRIDFNDVLTWARKHNALKENMRNDESITTVHWYSSRLRRPPPTYLPTVFPPHLPSRSLSFLASFSPALCSHSPLAFFSQIAFETIHFCRQGLFATAKHCKSCTAYGSLSLIYFHFSHFLLLAIMSLRNGSVNIVM